MDDFKRAGIVVADDVGLSECQYTALRPESKAKAKRIASRYARRKLKQDLSEVIEIIERFNAHENLYEQQRGKNV